MNFTFRSKLFRQLIGIFSLLIIIAVGIPGAFYMYYFTPNLVAERYHQVMINDADFLAQRLDWLLEKGFADIYYLSGKVGQAGLNNLDEVKNIMDIFINSSPIFTGGTLTDKNGMMLLFYSTPQGFIELKQQNDVSHRDYIRTPLKTKQKFLSEVTITSNSPVIFLSSPVLENGQVTGVLALSVNLLNKDNIFQSLFQGFREHMQGDIYVVDQNGLIFFHKNPDMVGTTIGPEILTEIKKNKEGIRDSIVDDMGKKAVAFSRPQNNNWVVVYEMRHHEIYAMSQAGNYSTIATMVVVLILGLISSYVFTRKILKPLEEIMVTTEKVAAGDLTQTITYEGRDDFQEVIKNFNSMICNLSSQYEQLENLSQHDYLTGLANRRYVEHQLNLELERALRLGHPLSILLLDIDNFKGINDKFGHVAGDKALKCLANELRTGIRESDLPGRYGGEEFVILLPETSAEQAQIVAEKIRERISSICIPSRKGNITFTISIGLASTEMNGVSGNDIGEVSSTLLNYADKAMYTAKSRGKNKVQKYEK